MIKNYSSGHIADMRVTLGITQQQLAKSLGISRSLVAMAETGRRVFPSSGLSLLKGMNQIASTMAMQEVSSPGKRKRRIGLRVYNRVSYTTRTHSFTHSAKEPGSQHPMTAYNLAGRDNDGYSLTLLKNRANAEELLNQLLLKKAGQQQQLQYLLLEKASAITRGIELTGQITAVTGQLEAGEQFLLQYPESTLTKKWKLRNAKHYYKKLLLEHKIEHFTAMALLQREYRINIAENNLLELNRVIDAVSRQIKE